MLLMLIIADIAAGPAFLIVGLLFGAMLFIPIVAVEAVVLLLLKWSTFWRCVRDSLIVNFSTTLLGIVLALLFPWYDAPSAGFFVLAWLLSIAVEGGLLVLLARRPARPTWIAASASIRPATCCWADSRRCCTRCSEPDHVKILNVLKRWATRIFPLVETASEKGAIMPTPIVGDFFAGPVIMIYGVVAGLIAFVPVVVIEATVLWLLKWGSFGRSLRDSAVANLVSMLLGLVFALVFALVFQSYEWYTWPPLIFGGVAWVLSILIEACTLGWLEHYESRRTEIAAVVINTVSYLVLAGVVAFRPLPFWV
jgi:hypothetical protein